MTRHTLTIALLTIALGGAIAWGFAGRAKEAATTDASPATDLASIEQRQAALDARMDRMETMISGIANAAGIALSKPEAANTQHAHGPEGPQSQATTDARMEQAKRQAEAAFAAEPVSQAWASRQSKVIAHAFSAERLAQLNSPAPRVQEAQCRSRSCRISAVYANQAQAEEAQLFLLSDIAGTLGRTRPFQRTLPDGSVELTMYAFATDPQRATR